MNETPSPITTAARPAARHRLHTWGWATAVLLCLALALAASLWPRVRLGAEAYLYGYPLVIMDVTRAGAATTLGPPNQLTRVRKFPDAQFKAVVRPNVDTLYTNAFIHTSQGPWLFEMGPNDQRYEVMPFMDAWTNVFASLGTRTTGTAGGRYLLVSPAWKGETPAGTTLLRAPTDIVWLIGRTQTNGVADFERVHRLQDGIQLRHWPLGSEVPPAHAASEAPPPHPGMTPVDQLKAMSTQAFFERLCALMVANPPAAADAPMLDKFAQLGLAPGQPPQWNAWQHASVALGRALADWKVAQELKKPRALVNGWSTPPDHVGAYGVDYATRAVVALVGLGANLPADAMYPNAKVDAQGQRLDGSHRYRLHFAKGELPPVRGFWSVTAYGANDYLIANPLNRYALGDRDDLALNADGSLDLWIQASAPTAPEQQRNWLPVKAGEPFLLNARLYWPKEAALQGTWHMPAIERVD